MEFFKTKTDCLQYALAEIIATLQDDSHRQCERESEHYTDSDRAELIAKIADIEAIESEVLKAFEAYQKRERDSFAPAKMIQIKNGGRAFNVRRVEVGDRYGLDDCLTYGQEKHDDPSNGDMIEFYDATANPEKFGDRGQFVSRYYASTLTGDAPVLGARGLCLQGDVPVWNITAEGMRQVFAWLDQGG